MMYWLQITSGSGPEECRWVVSQLVSYLIDRASNHKFHTALIETVPGNVPGTLSSAVIAMEGENTLTEFVSAWEGTIQWIGTSMFRPDHKRRNWFVSVKVFEPVRQEDLRAEDIRVECMRSSGPGGQHANTTETAIRVTHTPTGLSAISQEERSQHLNKKLARARLEELLRLKEHQARTDLNHKCWNQHRSIERGNAVHVFTGKRFRLKNS